MTSNREVNSADWTQLQVAAAAEAFNLAAKEEGLLPIKLTRFYRGKVYEEAEALGHLKGPLCRCALSNVDRVRSRLEHEVADFVNDRQNAVPNLGMSLIRKYHDRVLFLSTDRCLSHCQYCFRTSVLSEQQGVPISPLADRVGDLVAYLSAHDEVEEVIVSGGDPLALPARSLCDVLLRLRNETGVKHIRIHTRALVFLPSVFSDQICEAFAAARVRVVHHIVHPYEICRAVKQAAERLRKHGVRSYNQFPMLRGVNDHSSVLARLLTDLDDLWIRNLSIFVPDPVHFSSCYRLPLSRLFGIVDELNLMTPAWVNSTRIVLDTAHGKVRRENLVSLDSERNVAIFERRGAVSIYPDLPSSEDEPGDLRLLLWRDSR
jgi:lysine 2,3-aminomutase